MDALVGKKIVKDLDDQLKLLVEKIRGEQSSQVREILRLSQKAKESHVKLRVIRLISW